MQVTNPVSEGASSTAVVDGLGDHRLVHFSCHPTPEKANPLDVSFVLHGGDRLTLLRIVRSYVPSLNLRSLQRATRRSVRKIAFRTKGRTLCRPYNIAGSRARSGRCGRGVGIGRYRRTGPRQARLQVIVLQKEGIPYYEKSAGALQDAVPKLRSQKISLERWVNFVRYGACTRT